MATYKRYTVKAKDMDGKTHSKKVDNYMSAWDVYGEFTAAGVLAAGIIDNNSGEMFEACGEWE